MQKTPRHIALFVKQHVPYYILTKDIQALDLIALCYHYMEVLERDQNILNEVLALRKAWWYA